MKQTNEVILDIQGDIIPQGIKGIIYLCKYTHAQEGKEANLEVQNILYFSSPGMALQAYANIPNPESQVAFETKESSFKDELEKLHQKMNNQEWVNQLGNYL